MPDRPRDATLWVRSLLLREEESGYDVVTEAPSFGRSSLAGLLADETAQAHRRRTWHHTPDQSPTGTLPIIEERLGDTRM